MYTFLMSIIGPNHRNPRTADIGNKLLNERPIMASDVEHREKRNAKISNNALAIGVATSSEPEKKVGLIHTWNRANVKAAAEKYISNWLNSRSMCNRKIFFLLPSWFGEPY